MRTVIAMRKLDSRKSASRRRLLANARSIAPPVDSTCRGSRRTSAACARPHAAATNGSVRAAGDDGDPVARDGPVQPVDCRDGEGGIANGRDDGRGRGDRQRVAERRRPRSGHAAVGYL